MTLFHFFPSHSIRSRTLLALPQGRVAERRNVSTPHAWQRRLARWCPSLERERSKGLVDWSASNPELTSLTFFVILIALTFVL